MKEKIKELRVKIDGLAQLVESLNQPVLIIDKSNIPEDMDVEELSKAWRETPSVVAQTLKHKIIEAPFLQNLFECHKSLLLSKAWLGKVLAGLGEETPYKNDGTRKSVEDIEPTDDKNEEVPFGDGVDKPPFRDKSYIEKIDWLREEIKGLIAIGYSLYYRDMQRYKDSEVFVNWVIEHSLLNLFQHLSEARFHLGFELQRIKEQEGKE